MKDRWKLNPRWTQAIAFLVLALALYWLSAVANTVDAGLAVLLFLGAGITSEAFFWWRLLGG
ncbi:MAG: hypothetical protein AAGD06_11500 [Acidobacteriota bacterium]